MKKNVIYLLMAVFALNFISCKDDDDDPIWKGFPKDPISGSNITLTVNDEPSLGSITLIPSNNETGELTLTNVLPGYAEIKMDVALTQQTDSSFLISGEKGLTTPPAMITLKSTDAQTIFNLTVKGTLTLKGKANVTVTSILTENAQGGLAGTWNLLNKVPFTDGTLMNAPLWMNYSPFSEKEPNLTMVSWIVNSFGSSIIFNLLKNVSFNENGNIIAEYCPEVVTDSIMSYLGSMSPDETGENAIFSHVNEKWATSPNNLAFWYAKGGYIYIVPNINAILKQTGNNDASSLDLTALLSQVSEYGIDITALLPQITEWMSTGIPLKYEINGSNLKLYVDKEMCKPIIEALLPALSVLDAKIEELGKTDPENTIVQMLPMLYYMLQIEKLADIENIWKTNTDEFGIALNLTTKEVTPASLATQRSVYQKPTAENLKAFIMQYLPKK